MISMAQAARRTGGIVIAQVKRTALRGTLPPKQIKIPGMLVDLIVVEPEQTQTFFTVHDPAYAGEVKVPLGNIAALPFSVRKIVARRAALELYSGAICNLDPSRLELRRWRPRKTPSTTSCSPTSRA